MSGKSPLEQPSRDHVDFLSSIPLLEESRKPGRIIIGAMTLDSWKSIPAVALRDSPGGLERRIALQASDITLEIVAEQSEGTWEFVARVYKKQTVTKEFVLHVGRSKLIAQREGFYHWSSKSPPRTIRLLSRAVQVNFGTLKWSQILAG
jgi:hypothetical protein